jgi:alpha-beta hydrolase superfamily lysophospholipase
VATLPDIARAVSRRITRRVLQAAGLVAGVGLAAILGFAAYAVSALPDLGPWHEHRLRGEYSALLDGQLDFAGYRALEERLFAAAGEEASAWAASGESFEFSRFNPAGVPRALAAGAPYNRSFRLTPAVPRGAALLVHGLTDSPYSMKALAESLHRQGIDVTVLRLPGHGTFPSMLTEMNYRDWQGAVGLAARDVAGRAGPGQPFIVGGYSTGGTLTLTYALAALDDPGLRRPDAVLLMSPAIELTPVAALANIIDAVAFLPVPIPVLEKVRWQDVLAEYDPYKFNSFPVNAARQVNRATRKLQAALEDAERSGRLASLPPVVTWQSVVDSTVGSAGTLKLYARLRGGQHRLVLFDVNRLRGLGSLQRPSLGAAIDGAVAAHPGYRLEVVTNASPDTPEVVLRRYAPGSPVPEVEPLGLAWPADVASLGHVALPFPPDDPVYGFLPGSGRDGLPSLGSRLLRGENGALTISLGSLTRLRSNPFWSLIDRQVAQLAAKAPAPGET